MRCSEGSEASSGYAHSLPRICCVPADVGWAVKQCAESPFPLVDEGWDADQVDGVPG